jgi:hypothetical protein
VEPQSSASSRVSSDQGSARQVTGISRTGEGTRQAVAALVALGFSEDAISVVARDGASVREFAVDRKTGAPTGAAAGAATGAAVGLALSVIPGVGIVASGPALGALRAFGAGTALGSLLGTLAGLGWWKVDVEIPADDVEAGAFLVGIRVPEARAAEAVDALRRAGAERVQSAAALR